MFIHVLRVLTAYLLAICIPFFGFSQAEAKITSEPGHCSELLSKIPPLNLAFRQTYFRTPVMSQEAGYCVDMSTIGHFESLLKQHFSEDWFTIKILEKDFFLALTEALQSPPKETFALLLKRELNPEAPEKFKEFVTGDHFGMRGYNLIEEIGLVHREDFKLTPEFHRMIAGFSQQLNLAWANGSKDPIPPFAVLTKALENLLSQLEDMQRNEKDPVKLAKFIEEITKMARRTFDVALKGFNGKYSPLENFNKLIQKKYPDGFNRYDVEGLSFHERIFLVEIDYGYPDKNKLEELIRTTIDQGYNLHIIYSHDPHFVDAKTGVLDIPDNFDRASFKQSQPTRQISHRHAALIEGYHLNDQGKIDWLLIKNSHGTEVYRLGYNRMTFQYLYELGFTVSRQMLPKE